MVWVIGGVDLVSEYKVCVKIGTCESQVDSGP